MATELLLLDEVVDLLELVEVDVLDELLSLELLLPWFVALLLLPVVPPDELLEQWARKSPAAKATGEA